MLYSSTNFHGLTLPLGSLISLSVIELLPTLENFSIVSSNIFFHSLSSLLASITQKLDLYCLTDLLVPEAFFIFIIDFYLIYLDCIFIDSF